MSVFCCCCHPSFAHTSPLRSRVKAFSNHKLSTPALCRRSLFSMSLIAYYVSPCSHYKNHSHEILHFCDFFDSQSCFNLRTWRTTPCMLQRELRVLDDHLLPYFNIERKEKGVMAVDVMMFGIHLQRERKRMFMCASKHHHHTAFHYHHHYNQQNLAVSLHPLGLIFNMQMLLICQHHC